MPYISSYDVVRVVRLNAPKRHFDGTEGVCRPPEIGDIGTLGYKDGRDLYQVESVDSQGQCLWQAMFHSSELESVQGENVNWDQLPAEAYSLTEQLRIGMNRPEVVEILGEPDSTSVISRKYRTPAIYCYGCVKLQFEPPKGGTLVRVYMEDDQQIGQCIGITLLE